MSCQALCCKEKAKFENGIGIQVCSTKCASKLAPDAHLIMAEHHHTLDHPSDPSLIRIHKTSPMIGIYRNEPTLILRQGKTSLDQCVAAERPDYFEVNKNVAEALKAALVGISKEEIEAELAKTRREAEELSQRRQELQRQLDQAKEEERKRKMDDSQAKKSVREAERERKKEEQLQRREEKARQRYREAKEKEAAQGGDDPRKKATGKQLDELNNDVLLVMFAHLDDDSLRSLAMVNHRFNNLAFPSLYEKATNTGKMRFMYVAILKNREKRLAYAFSNYNKFGFSMGLYFRKLLMWSSPWSKASKFAYYDEEMNELSAWHESEGISAQQVEYALDIFIRVNFFKENAEGERQSMNTPYPLRFFVRNMMYNMAVFHHIGMLNRFFNDYLWRQTIVIDPNIAKQEIMIQAANAGFKEFVEQMVADPTIDLSYKNSSVFGVAIGEAYRSPYMTNDEGTDGPVDISNELDQVCQVLMQSGRQFEKRNPDTYLEEPVLFKRSNQWWDIENGRPEVVEEGVLLGPVTSKKNTSLSNAIFNVRKNVINLILPTYSPVQLTDDIQLARMLVYYYPVAGEQSDSDREPPIFLDLFDRVMQQSGNMLVPTNMGKKIITNSWYYLVEGAGQMTDKLNKYDFEPFCTKLRDVLLRDPRLSLEHKMEINNACRDTIAGKRMTEEEFDRFDEQPYDEEDEDEKHPDPWRVYWQQVDQASAMQM